jgi:hypothetical protein
MEFGGSCHCGNVRVAFETRTSPEQTQIRLCQCSFCRKHAARAAADPAGHLRIDVADAGGLTRYRFGLATADFLVCGRCGVYVAAVMFADDGAYAVLNVSVLDDRERFSHAGVPLVYDEEDVATRTARRKQRWTPATVRGL